MCGIAGIINFAGESVEPARLTAADRALAHRGPDDAGTWIGRMGSASVGLVHRRLSIIDLSHEAAQPMWDPAGRLCTVFNGEIYNFQALQRELVSRFAFRTHCDTEVILAAYDAWAEGAWHHLAGMWGLALLDLRRDRLWLSRDRFGIKPLWYARTGEQLAFASELPALLAIQGHGADIDPAGIAEYLSLGTTLSPRTVLQGVQKLPPGWMLRVEPDGRVEPTAWYQPTPTGSADRAVPSFPDAARRFRSILADVVRDHLVADVPVGVLLSGGIDSSILAAAAVQSKGSTVRTFSVGFADQPAYDEGAYATAVARHLGCEHTALRLTLADIHAELPDLLDALDEPFGDSSYLPTTMLSQITRRHVTVALSGDGGDELFGGYWRYRGHAAWRKVNRIPAPLRRWIGRVSEALPVGRSSGWRNRVRQVRKLLSADSPDPIARHLVWARIADARTLNELVPDAAITAQAHQRIDQTYRGQIDRLAGLLPDRDPLSAILAADLFTLLPDDMLHKVDRGSMRVALEARVPLLDHRIVEFALGLPMSYKLHDGAAKRLLKQAYAADLPEQVFTRPKRGFEVPVAEFFRTAWYGLTREVLNSDALPRCGVSRDGALRLLDEHRAGRHDHSGVLFSLLTLAWWARRNLGGSRR